MAKNRHIATIPKTAPASPTEPPGGRLFTRSTGIGVAAAMAAMAIVYVAYWPHDSTEVQQGAARYLVAWLIAASGISLACYGPVARVDHLIDLLAGCLAGWMTVSLVAQANQANLRWGVNELGWWFAIAALISTLRRVASDASTSALLMRLIAAVSLGVAVFGWHQWLIGFPRMIADYQANPDAMLRQLGIDAAEGSAIRIIFENRLYDGGPTGTFALANSMAALLIGGLVVMLGMLITAWSRSGTIRRAVWIIAIAIVAGMLLAARSRSAILSLVLLGGWITIHHVHSRRARLRSFGQRRRLFAVVAMGLLVTVVGLGYAFRTTEWIQQAPASLAIRLNYWLACLKMVSQSPWFGVGPGQFKARYESFRAAASSEQIADPHQFLLQTVTSGGIPALVVLLGLLGMLAWICCRRDRFQGREKDFEDVPLQIHSPPRSSAAAAAGGAMIGLAGVWLLGTALGQMPSMDAALVATAIAVGFALWIGYRAESIGKVQDEATANKPSGATKAVRGIAAYAAVAIGIDLLASGGMTVPGVSVVAWVLVAIAVPVERQSLQGAPAADGSRWWRRGAVVVTLLSLLVWHRVGIAPIEQAKLLGNRFESAWARGQLEPALQALEQAAAADRWDVQPLLQLSAVYRSLAISRPQMRPAWEAKWLAAEQEALARAGRDPVVMRQLGDNRLIHFQRFGDPETLEAADRLFSRAVELAPAHETYAAQWAEILRARGDERAREIASRAENLARAGGYYERSLDFTMVLPAVNFGSEISSGDVRRPAAEVLAPLLEQRE